jgi:hypothetical protein
MPNAKSKMRIARAWSTSASVLLSLVVSACASNSPQEAAYNAFLNKVAADCKPLIIGSDDIGQAIVFNGLGAKPENYNNFLGQTSGLYNGGIPPENYRSSLTSFLGAGTYNKRSFDCIIAHLPQNSPGAANPPAPTK